MINDVLVRNIASCIKAYASKQSILHAQFLNVHSNFIKLSMIDLLPQSGFIFDDQMKRWSFNKHGCGYEFTNEGMVIDINDNFLSYGDIFNRYRLHLHLNSIDFKFNEEDADDAIEAALDHLGKLCKTSNPSQRMG